MTLFTSMVCPKCSWHPIDRTRDGVVYRFECPKCGHVEHEGIPTATPGPPGGNVEDLRFGSNYGRYNK